MFEGQTREKGGVFCAPLSAEFSEKQSHAFASALVELPAGWASEVSTERTRKAVASKSFAPRSSSLQSAYNQVFNQPISNLSISRPLELQLAALTSGKSIPRLVEPRLVEALRGQPAKSSHTH